MTLYRYTWVHCAGLAGGGWCTGSPRVAKGSGSAAKVGCSHQGPCCWAVPQSQGRAWAAAQVSCIQDTHPDWQLFLLPPLGLVCAQALGLQRGSQKRYSPGSPQSTQLGPRQPQPS